MTPEDVKKKREERFGKVAGPTNPGPKRTDFKKKQGGFNKNQGNQKKRFNNNGNVNGNGGNFQRKQGGQGFQKRRFSSEGKNNGGNKNSGGGNKKRMTLDGSDAQQRENRLARFLGKKD